MTRAEPDLVVSTGRREAILQWSNVMLSAATFIVIAFYTHAAYIQAGGSIRSTEAARNAADAAKRSADIAQDTLVVGQRAFISHVTSPVMNGRLFKIDTRWQNSGNTPTKTMKAHISFSDLMTSPLPEDFAFPDLWKEGRQHIV